MATPDAPFRVALRNGLFRLLERIEEALDHHTRVQLCSVSNHVILLDSPGGHRKPRVNQRWFDRPAFLVAVCLTAQNRLSESVVPRARIGAYSTCFSRSILPEPSLLKVSLHRP
ncbi:hypothetical protein [Paraburkholderia ultramafica]|uniref:hypothetical protein n=1 Tax=Paraburkholderia ultramafica TaxID=1544867 RepID=UPI001582B732|nr:hypothetical protein [Paraburkholderia ultramafica]